MAQIAEEFDEKYVFVYVDCDKCEQVQDMFQVATMPTFLIFNGPGAPVDRMEGVLLNKIREMLEQNQGWICALSRVFDNLDLVCLSSEAR